MFLHWYLVTLLIAGEKKKFRVLYLFFNISAPLKKSRKKKKEKEEKYQLSPSGATLNNIGHTLSSL